MASSLNQYKYSTNSIFIGEKTKIFLSGLAVKESITVHSVFHKVINLRTTQGLFSIVTSEVGRHNNYIVVTKLPNDDFLSINLSNNPSCILSKNSLVLDNKLSISLNLAKPWKGILDNGFKWKLSELKNESLLYLKTALCIYSKENSFFERLFIKEEDFLREAARSLEFNSRNLFLGFKLLIGYGPGLTPAGDDLLTGYMAVLTSCGDAIYCKEALRKSLLASLKRTNYISSSMLLNAANNIYHEHIQNLIYATICEEPESIFRAAKKIIGIGATSGSDLATGIYLGFQYAFESIGRQGGNIAY